MGDKQYTMDEIGEILSAVSKSKMADLRAIADQFNADRPDLSPIAKSGSKEEVADRLAGRYNWLREQAKTAPVEPAPATEPDPKRARPVRMRIVRASGTERVTNWATVENARSFAVQALADGSYQSAAIEIDGEFVEVHPDGDDG